MAHVFVPSHHQAEVGRELCRLRGEDPDEIVAYNDGSGLAVHRERPRWYVAAREVFDHMLIHRAAEGVTR